MITRRSRGAIGVLLAGAIALTACAAPADDDTQTDGGGDSGTTVTVAWNQEFFSSNGSTQTGNATANANINYMTGAGFTAYDDSPKLTQNKDFGTYEKISDDPLQVKYTVGDDVTWSDGTPIDAADLLLYWAANSGKVNTPDFAPETDDNGNAIAADGQVYFDGSIGGGLEKVSAVPEISEDDKSITLTYDDVFVDWEQNVFWGQSTPGMPAHIVAEEALGLDDAQKAKDALVTAVQTDDTASLSKIADFWNTGFNFTSLPTDPKLLVSSGAYTMTDFVAGQSLTLSRNDKYTWGPKPKADKIVVRYIPDALAAVTALQNGEVDLISPQATADVTTALKGIDGVTTLPTVDATYEHIDLNTGNSRNPGVFSDVRVRQAFLKTIPRKEIVDTLIKPINPDAEVRNSFILSSEFPGYDEMVAANGSSAYADVDIEGAKALLAEAGVTNPEVCMLFGSDNTRRVNEFGLIQASANSAGFNVTDCSSTTWSADLSKVGAYDAAIFGWQSESLGVTESKANFVTGGANNFYGYSNPTVDGIFAKLDTTTDKDEQLALQTQADSALWADAFGTTIYQFPGVTAYSDSLKDVSVAPLSPTVFWNYYDWDKS